MPPSRCPKLVLNAETVANAHESAAEVAASSGFDIKESRGPRKWVFEAERSARSSGGVLSEWSDPITFRVT